jgi:hypothetical protein
MLADPRTQNQSNGIGEALLAQRTFEPLYTFASTTVFMGFRMFPEGTLQG